MGILGNIVGKRRVQLIQNNNTVVQLDCSLKENHKRESTPTENPIEDGTNISDHIILKPHELELTGFISDTPIGDAKGLITELATSTISSLLPPVGVVAAAGASALFSALANSSSPSVAAYGQLLQLQANGLPVDVYTSLMRYSNMWITSISVPRDPDNGQGLMFTVNLKQLIIVAPQTVNVQIFANPGLSANQADTGDQSGIPSGLKAGRLAGLRDTAAGGTF